ncbi:N-acetylmuramoyl-L-alanine amidase [Paenibacillus sp. GCM10012307]|uniref:N-acetylmuramoyl-L-alanine amidase n=1 Tax=Paenibacillus roseus TaxID=2798579 RepID=A0A934J933_9BACL|nr:N-acetylmuramoyl-L-alanine amidase [Paenibacillus roseus]MBJ6363828.1 N-acetylmuramoyl-L-alanine amidase [Paenibacillus roseus]
MRKIVLMTVVVMCLSVLINLVPAELTAAGSYTAKVLNGPLSVRSDADGKSKVVGSIAKSETVTVTADAFGWSKVKTGNLTGWVAGYYLKKVDNSDTGSTEGQGKPAKTADVKPLSLSSGTGIVTADSLRIRAEAGTKYDVIGGLRNGDVVTITGRKDDWLQIQVSGSQKGWVAAEYIREDGSAKTTPVVFTPSKGGKGLKNRVIVVDPGHGGSDPGVIGTKLGTEEKTINLSTSLYLAEELRSRGAKVVMTRGKDEKPPLEKRVQTSHAAGADAFISIHYNSSTKNSSGTLTFYYDEKKDAPLARAIDMQLGSSGNKLKNIGISFGDLHVLRENRVPAALVELGFLTNEYDEKLVITDAYQRRAAAAIANGLERYFTN